MAWFDVDDSQWPLAVLRFDGVGSDDDFVAMLAGLDQLYARGRRFALVMDATRAGTPPASQRKLMADWLRANTHLIEQWCVGTAYVIRSPAVRGVLTAIFWLQPQPAPWEVFGLRRDAEGWARDRLRAEL